MVTAARTVQPVGGPTSRDAEIPGRYAAGELAGMAGGPIHNAALGGVMFGPCLWSGRLAGVAAAGDRGEG